MKNIAYLLLFFLLTSANTTAQANTLAGGSGWRVASTVSNGIGVTVNGAKDIIVNGAKKTVTGVANVTPTAGQVGKFMGKNLGAAAVVGAMDLLLDGVDYVMDPANNSVTYKTKECTTNCQYVFRVNAKDCGSTSNCDFSTVEAAGSTFCANYNSTGGYKFSHAEGTKIYCFRSGTSGSTWHSYISKVLNPSYDSSKEEERKSVPLVNLGSRVLEQAETEVKTGNPAVPIATPVTQAAATAVVGEAATDDVQARPIVTELDKSATYPTTEDATGTIDTPAVTDPVTGEVVKPAEQSSIKFTFPKACEWFPQACEFIDWVRTDPEVESEMELPEKEIERHQIDGSLPCRQLRKSTAAAPKFLPSSLPCRQLRKST